MRADTSPGVDVFVRVGDNEELHVATIRDATSSSQVLRELASELTRLAGPVLLVDRVPGAVPLVMLGDDVYAEDLL